MGENQTPSVPYSYKTLTTHPADQALNHTHKTDWLVQNLIVQPSLNLIVGASGTKKTYAVLDLAVSLALGKPWLNAQTQWGDVLWIDEEAGLHRFFIRLAQSMRAHDAPEDLRFNVSSLTGVNLRDPEDIHALTIHARVNDTKLIVIDPLAGVLPGADENSVLTLVPVFKQLRALAHRMDLAIILIHHTNKSGVYRGSTHLRGAVDLMLMVHSKPDLPLIEFQSIKTRDISHQNFAAEIHFDPPGTDPERVWLTPASLPQTRLAVHTTQPLTPAIQHILSYLETHGPSEIMAVLEDPQDCTRDQARSAIYRLEKRDVIERINEGAQGSSAIYALVEMY